MPNKPCGFCGLFLVVFPVFIAKKKKKKKRGGGGGGSWVGGGRRGGSFHKMGLGALADVHARVHV